jgi:hypothetical protein
MFSIQNSRKKLPYAPPPVKRRSVAPPVDVPTSPYTHDCAGFIHDHIQIDNAQPDMDGPDAAPPTAMPFLLWPAQAELLIDLLCKRLILILKARQLGISWLVLAYALWLCLFRPGRLVLVFSIGQLEANEMLRRCSAMYWRLTPELRTTLPHVTKDTTEELAWANGSRIISLPSRANAGSSYTASLAIMDEFAKNARDAALYTAVKPTIDGGGQLIILSTANGANNVFHTLVKRALDAAGRFAFRFIPWHARPGRDQAWYASVEADSLDSSLMKQEYPATPEEAFEATEVNAFLTDIGLWNACRTELPAPDAHTRMVLGLDGAESNDTFASVMVSTWEDRYAVRYSRPYVPTPGSALDFNEIEIDIRKLGQTYAIAELTYDPMLLGQLIMRLQSPAILYRAADPETPLHFPAFPAPCVPFPQGQARMIADKGTYDGITQRRLLHDGNEALTAHVANANKKIGRDGRSIRIVKRVYEKKIDSLVCLSMTYARAMVVLAEMNEDAVVGGHVRGASLLTPPNRQRPRFQVR